MPRRRGQSWETSDKTLAGFDRDIYGDDLAAATS
jgi:hypothetical protein